MRICGQRLPEAFIRQVVEKPALHASELPDGDVVAVGDAGSVLGDWVIQTHLALIDKLQQRCDRERLGDTADPLIEALSHRRAGGGVGDAECSYVVPVARPNPHDCTRDAFLAYCL